jgi:hypothetical protein
VIKVPECDTTGSLAAKDPRLAVEYAHALGVPMSVVPEAARALASAMSQGLSDRDWSSYITLIATSSERTQHAALPRHRSCLWQFAAVY